MGWDGCVKPANCPGRARGHSAPSVVRLLGNCLCTVPARPSPCPAPAHLGGRPQAKQPHRRRISGRRLPLHASQLRLCILCTDAPCLGIRHHLVRPLLRLGCRRRQPLARLSQLRRLLLQLC